MANVKFNRGKTRANSITASKTPEGYSNIYFPTDSATIILGIDSTTDNREYGQAVQDAAGTEKAFLLGHSTQGTIATTISNANVYMQADKLYSNDSEVVNVADVQTITAAKTFSGGISMNGAQIRKVKTPTANDDAVNKQYVDSTVKLADNAVQIKYTDLKSLRDTGKLVPGTQYRITDYTCNTTQENTKSAGHQFDIIVTADDEITLNEVARAVKHEGDNYFDRCNLNAWKIWYCLDNDTTRFAWATPDEALIGTIPPIPRGGGGSGTYTYSSPISKIEFQGKAYNLEIGVRTMIYSGPPVYATKTDDYTLVVEDAWNIVHGRFYEISVYTVSQEGKGVIYRMIDEWNNDVPYDFYSILPEGKPVFPYPFTGRSHNNTIKPDRNEHGQMIIPGVYFEKDVSNIEVSKNSKGGFVAYNVADLFATSSDSPSPDPSPDNPSPYGITGTVYYIGEI